MHTDTHSNTKLANKTAAQRQSWHGWLQYALHAIPIAASAISDVYRWPHCHVCPAIAISNIVVPGVAISSVDMIPIRAYAKAQKGKASGSLHGSQ